MSKLAAEQLVHNAARRGDLTAPPLPTSLRMFNVYGPRQSLDNPYQGVVSVFIADVLAGRPVTVFGDGLQTRDFVYVEDVADGWLAALERDATAGMRINLGSGREHTILALLDAVLSALGQTREGYEVLWRPDLPGDQRTIRAELRLAASALDWRPTTTLSDGLREAVAWARSLGPCPPAD